MFAQPRDGVRAREILGRFGRGVVIVWLIRLYDIWCEPMRTLLLWEFKHEVRDVVNSSFILVSTYHRF